ncbi:hypothetical protein Hdeb2414_s0015g00441171 [Helianthus debilis subsp. tardiflorus]
MHFVRDSMRTNNVGLQGNMNATENIGTSTDVECVGKLIFFIFFFLQLRGSSEFYCVLVCFCDNLLAPNSENLGDSVDAFENLAILLDDLWKFYGL